MSPRGNAAADALLARRTPPAPAPAPEPSPPTRARRTDDRCPICARRRDEHHPCPVCRSPLEHHPGGATPDDEWAGLARMAAAKQTAGGALTGVEAEALRRVPAPEFLCGTCRAYRARGHECATPAPASPGAPADPSPRAGVPATPSWLEETTVFPDHGGRREPALEPRPRPFVALVTGSRSWTDGAPIEADLRRLQAVHGARLAVVHGFCLDGADAIADRVARRLGIGVERVPAEWGTHDRDGLTPVPCRCPVDAARCRAAGPRRNQRMLDEHHPDLVLAYRSPGASRGTDDMVRRARVAGVAVEGAPNPQGLAS